MREQKNVNVKDSDLDAALDALAESRLHADAMRGKIKLSPFYQISVVALSFVAALGMLFFIAPKIAVAVASAFFLITVAMLIFSALPSCKKRFDGFKMLLPIVREIERKRSLCVVAEHLSGLAADYEPETAMRVAANDPRVNRAFVTPVLRAFEIATLLNVGGASIRYADTFLERDVFPPQILCYLKKGEDDGAIAKTFAKISDFYKEETEAIIDSLSSLAQPAAICLLIAIVGGVLAVIYKS